MGTHFLGDVKEKIVVHDNADADQQFHVKTVALEKLVNTAPLLMNGASEPRNTTALGLEFLFDHVAEMNGLIVHFVSNVEYRHKNRIYFNITNNFEKIFLEKVFF